MLFYHTLFGSIFEADTLEAGARLVLSDAMQRITASNDTWVVGLDGSGYYVRVQTLADTLPGVLEADDGRIYELGWTTAIEYEEDPTEYADCDDIEEDIEDGITSFFGHKDCDWFKHATLFEPGIRIRCGKGRTSGKLWALGKLRVVLNACR